MNRMALLGVAWVLVVACSGPIAAHPAHACGGLEGEAARTAEYVLATEHPYDCCDDTIAKCLEKSPQCPLVRRLASYVCRLAAAGKSKSEIQRSLQRRALSMMRPGKTYAIDVDPAMTAGCSKAPVKLVAYLCARCPFCSKLGPALYREVTSGRLRGKASLSARLFPIKSHEHSAQANMACQAAAALGSFWDYLLKVYAHFDDFTPDRLGKWAAEVGLDTAAFDRALQDPATRKRLVASKKEGLRNGVKATPTLFIDGRKYLGDLDIETIVDVALEEYDAIAGDRRPH